MTKIYWSNVNLVETEERYQMMARRGACVALVVILALLVFGCGREEPKSNFELGKEYFQASDYKKAMIRLETWLQEDTENLQGHNNEIHAMLIVMYHDDETRKPHYAREMAKIREMGETGTTAVLKLMESKKIGDRLGNTISDILVQADELSVEPLMKEMKGANPRLRKYAQGVLIKIGASAVESLIEDLSDPSVYTRSMVVEALSRIGDKRAVEPLKKMLDDPNKLIQVTVAAALHGMGQMNPTKVIVDALGDENLEARRAAARAVWEIIDDPPLKPLLKAMEDSDSHVRDYAAKAVGKTRNPEAVKPLIKILQEDESAEVKTSAATSLVKIGKPAVEPLIKIIEGMEDMGLTIRVVQILGEIGDKRADKPLDKLYMEATNPLLKDETAKALNKLRP